MFNYLCILYQFKEKNFDDFQIRSPEFDMYPFSQLGYLNYARFANLSS